MNLSWLFVHWYDARNWTLGWETARLNLSIFSRFSTAWMFSLSGELFLVDLWCLSVEHSDWRQFPVHFWECWSSEFQNFRIRYFFAHRDLKVQTSDQKTSTGFYVPIILKFVHFKFLGDSYWFWSRIPRVFIADSDFKNERKVENHESLS